MIFNKVKVYLVGAAIVFGLKYFYSNAGINDLEWILTPTARWVGILSGITFEYEPQVGYVNHYFRFIIAPSCSGVQFMIITFATLIYSFVHRMRTMRGGFCWIALSLVFSYLFTIFVNGFRIVIAIYLPLYLHKPDDYSGWMTPERLHTTIGIVIYFTSLFAIYHTAGYVSQKIAGMPKRIPDRTSPDMLRKCMPPIFWYFFIALGIPFLNRAYKNNFKQFMEYAILMTAVCLAIILLFCLVSVIYKQFGRRKNQQ